MAKLKNQENVKENMDFFFFCAFAAVFTNIFGYFIFYQFTSEFHCLIGFIFCSVVRLYFLLLAMYLYFKNI